MALAGYLCHLIGTEAEGFLRSTTAGLTYRASSPYRGLSVSDGLEAGAKPAFDSLELGAEPKTANPEIGGLKADVRDEGLSGGIWGSQE